MNKRDTTGDTVRRRRHRRACVGLDLLKARVRRLEWLVFALAADSVFENADIVPDKSEISALGRELGFWK